MKVEKEADEFGKALATMLGALTRRFNVPFICTQFIVRNEKEKFNVMDCATSIDIRYDHEFPNEAITRYMKSCEEAAIIFIEECEKEQEKK